MAHEEGSNGTVNLLSLFPYFIYCLDPDPYLKLGSGSTKLLSTQIQFGSGSTTLVPVYAFGRQRVGNILGHVFERNDYLCCRAGTCLMR